MLLHRYLETLLGSKTKIKILRSLNKNREKEFTIRELADFIQISHTGVRKALEDLYEMNVVKLKVSGRNHIITLNEESYLIYLIKILFEQEENTIKELGTDIHEHLCTQPSVKSIKVFGSVAAGQEHNRSDIDLLIITNDPAEVENPLTELQILCSKKYGNPISPYILTLEQEKHPSNQSLHEEIQKKHITICDNNSDNRGKNT